MNIQITLMSTLASSILSANTSAYLHSSYQKAINLSIGNALLTLQPKDSAISPLTLLTTLSTEELSHLASRLEQPITLTSSAFHTKEDCISFSQAKYFDCELSTLSYSASLLKETLKHVILSSSNNGFVNIYQPESKEEPLIVSVARKRVHAARESIHCKDDSSAVSLLISLIGLGIGLTPSGDDFLCGCLAGLKFSNQWFHPFAKELKAAITEHLSDTNDISRAFLQCAINGFFGTAVHHLLDLPKEDFILNEFQNIGHSSGMDTLCGIYFILDTFF